MKPRDYFYVTDWTAILACIFGLMTGRVTSTPMAWGFLFFFVIALVLVYIVQLGEERSRVK